MCQSSPGGIINGVDPVEKRWLARRREAPVSSEEEKNKALVRRFIEAQLEKDLAALEEMMAPDFVDRSLMPGQEPDREGFKHSVAENVDTFSDISYTIDDQIAEGDKVTTWYTGSSTHDRGPFMGIPPTGKRESFKGVFLHRIVGDKIVEEWSLNDALDVMLSALEQQMRERERVEQELLVARRIQQASLPKEIPSLEGWQIAPYYQPAREVGGDFYDFHLLSEGRLGLVVGDATGKGVPAALVMSTTCGMLQAVSEALDSSSSRPGEVLKRANEALTVRIPPNMFVTCFYAILDPKSGSLTYANAGHDLPYLCRNGEAEELMARGMPLGLMPGMSYEEKETLLQAGEAALLYSDGLVEAHGPEGDMFGFPRLRARVAEHGGERELGDFLLEELYSFVGESWEQEDDITLLTLRRSSPRT
jgi:serine phosphatase RsbU (regulator of sigma subunit)/ketosteroid isomerase-like protein